jgi:hypothetical protein
MEGNGDAMHSYDQELVEPARRVGEARHQSDDTSSFAARRAVEAGSARRVEPAAVVRLQRLVGNSGVVSLMEQEPDERSSPVLDVVGRGGGAPLAADVRTEMEAGLGADFGDVKVHDDDTAAASAQAVNAKAYTVGDEIVFNRGAYQPDTESGRHTLAHELTHVVQQRSGPVDGTPTGDGVSVSHPDDRFEQEAEASAASLVDGSTPRTSAPTQGDGAAGVQRQEGEGEEEEELTAQTAALQRQEGEEEEELTAQTVALQRQDVEEEEEGEPAP